MINLEQFGKGYRKEKFKLRHLLRRRLNIHAKYLTANPVDMLAVAKLFSVKNQDGSGSCGGQAWADYIQNLKYLRDNAVVELSAKDIYSHCFIAPEGSTEGDLIVWVENNGVDTESDVPSYINGVPQGEIFYETITPRNEDVAMQQIVFQPITFSGDINSIKQAITLGNGCVIAVWGDNAGWQTANVVPPVNRVWGHWLHAVQFNDSLRVVTCKNSWGSEAGDGGYYYLPYSYFTGENCMGGWIYQLRPATYTITLMEQIVQLYQNLIQKLTKK